MEGQASMLTTIGNVFTQVINWCGEVFDSLTATDGALNGLMELLAIGIGISLVLVAVRVIRSIAWGA